MGLETTDSEETILYAALDVIAKCRKAKTAVYEETVTRGAFFLAVPWPVGGQLRSLHVPSVDDTGSRKDGFEKEQYCGIKVSQSEREV